MTEVRRAHKEAARLCDLHYNRHPDLTIISNNRSPNESREAPITLAYVQSHLHHMLFEVIKNSMRATVENFPDPDTPLPPIKPVVSSCQNNKCEKLLYFPLSFPFQHVIFNFNSYLPYPGIDLL